MAEEWNWKSLTIACKDEYVLFYWKVDGDKIVVAHPMLGERASELGAQHPDERHLRDLALDLLRHPVTTPVRRST